MGASARQAAADLGRRVRPGANVLVARSTHKELYPRIERVQERLFEGEESVLHLMGCVAVGALVQNPESSLASRREIGYRSARRPISDGLIPSACASAQQ